MERVVFAPAMSFNLSFFLRPKISQYFESRTPLFKLHFPVHNDGCGYNNQMRTPYSFITGKGCQHRNGLDGFTQAHFVSQDAVEFAVVKSYKPVKANNLVLSELALDKEGHLCVNISLIKRRPSRLENISHLSLLFCNLLLRRLFV